MPHLMTSGQLVAPGSPSEAGRNQHGASQIRAPCNDLAASPGKRVLVALIFVSRAPIAGTPTHTSTSWRNP
jgi:hypothetical protein